MRSRTYNAGRSSITLRFGDITQSTAEVLVSSDDFLLSMGGGVSAALLRAGGARVAADASKMVPARIGDVVVSTAGDLPARYIFHAVTIGQRRQELEPAIIVRQTTLRAMQLLGALRCSSIAFPAIGAGLAGIPYQDVAAEMAAVLVGTALESQQPYRIELFLMDRYGHLEPEDFFVFFEEFAARKAGFATGGSKEAPVLSAPVPATATMSPEQASEAARRADVHAILQRLGTSRSRIEGKLIETLASADPHEEQLALLKKELDELEELRRSYLAQLEPAETARRSVVPHSVFVSSTSSDMRPYREAVRGAIEDLRLRYVGMEDFSATGTPPQDLIRQKVDQSETYLGILGMRYGSVYTGLAMSMTELEYHQALTEGKPVRLFVMDERAPITAGMVERDPELYSKLAAFKERVMRDHTCKLFTTPEDLATKVKETLRDGPA